MALCMNCMSETDGNTVCPYCSFDNTSQQKAPFLPYGTLLNNRYTVGAVKDINGESVCYIGFDNKRSHTVRIREFLPFGFFERAAGKKNVEVSEENLTVYDSFFNEFVLYYRILSQLKGLSANVDIIEIFPENNTCYSIEEAEELITFAEYIKRSGGRLEWDIARPMIMPVISLLETMHANGIGHYALSAQNVYVTPSGKLKLLGFATENVRKSSALLKPSLAEGVSAPEQYEVNGLLDEQTDVYGFTALLFYALSGNLPANAEKRKNSGGKLYMNSFAVKRLPPHVLSALGNGLYIDRKERTKTFDELRSQLSAEHTVEAIREQISRTSMIKAVTDEEKDKKNKSNTPVFLISFVITALIIILVVAALYSCGFFESGDEPTAAISVTESSTDDEWSGPVVRNYVGLSYDEAVQSLENTGIELVRSYKVVYSDIYEEGVIVSQQPEAGTPITSSDGSAVIYVEVSSGSNMRTLPDIAGYDLDSAASTLGDMGFIVTQITEYSETVASGAVIGYDGYSAGDRLETGSTVTVRVSKGAPPSNDTDQNDYDVI